MSVVRYTAQELEMRRRAQVVLDDAGSGDWHRKRALGDLKRTEKAARARAAQREAQEAKPTDPPSHRKAWEGDRDYDERRRAEEFLAAIGGTPVVKPEAPTAPAQAEVPAASVAPRASRPERFCERCQVSFEVCHCDKPKPTSAELADVAARDAQNNDESADDLTLCSLCLIPRGQCHHSGRRNPAADISFLQSQMT